MLIGCGLRRGELLSLAMDSIQVRDEHWVIADLKGKAGRVRAAPAPQWVEAAVDVWSAAPGITKGTLLRSINTSGSVWGDGMMLKVLWEAENSTKFNFCPATSRFKDRTIPRMQAEAEPRR